MIKKAAFVSLFIAVSMITSLPSAPAAYFIQVNSDGFGSSHNAGNLEVKTMAVFKNKLYVGVANQVDGAQVFCFDGTTWQRASESGFGMRDNIAITALCATDNLLYAGTSNRTGGQVWCYDGTEWRCLHQGRFGSILSNAISSMAYYQGLLYAGLWDQLSSKPTEVWAFDGESSWEQANKPGFGSPHNLNTLAMQVSRVDGEEKLYALVWKSFQYKGKDAGCEVWAFDGKGWKKVNEGREGFGEKGKGRSGMEPYSMAEFQGKLYVGLWAFEGGRFWEVWAYDGQNWELTNSSVSGAGNEPRLCIALTPYKGQLYAVATDGMKEFELWAYDGKAWVMVVGKGCATPEKLGDPRNKVINAMAVYQNQLYLGVVNAKAGYRVWKSNLPEIIPHREPLSVGEMELFTLSGSTAPSVTWNSNNPAIASIEQATGLVQAAAPGECLISAKDSSGYSATPLRIRVEERRNEALTEKIFLFPSVTPPRVVNNSADKSMVKAVIYTAGTVPDIERVSVDLSPIHQGIMQLSDSKDSSTAKERGAVYSAEISVPPDVAPGDYALPISARSKTGIEGKAVVSVTVTQRYTIPEIVSLRTMGTGYHIPILFDIKNPDRDQCSVTIEYKAEGGSWLPASIYCKTGLVFAKGLLTKLETTSDISRYVCVWESEKDIGKKAGTFFVRLTPQDDKEKGNSVLSAPVLINNQKPPANEMVYVPAGKFHIDKYEYPNHFGYYPEINITWYEARTKCQVQGKDLCTPEQWEMAYYGNAKKRYPYGDTYGFKDRDFCNTTGSADGVMTPSGVYENCVNDLGIYDLGGNIYEWVGLNEKNSLMADQSYQYDVMVQSLFNFDDPSHRHYFLGFRCCKGDKEQ